MEALISIIGSLLLFVIALVGLALFAARRAKQHSKEVLVLRSSFQTDDFVWQEYNPLLDKLMIHLGANFSIVGDDFYCDEPVDNPDYVMIATGGVENLFVRLMPFLGDQIVLIADGRNNSLAAAIEILTYLQLHQKSGLIVHGSPEVVLSQLRSLRKSDFKKTLLAEQKNENLAPIFQNQNILCIGKPSDWLIASGVDTLLLNELGIERKEINPEVLVSQMNLVDPGVAQNIAVSIRNKAQKINVSDDELFFAAKIYAVMESLCRKEHISALTIRCFDLLKQCNTTSCVALSLLNDAGIVAACEGDMQSLLSMMLLQKCCSQVSFMANPSFLTDKTTTLAHCTIPTRMCSTFSLSSHFESGKGVAIVSMLSSQTYTLFKWGGPHMNKFFVTEAQAIEADYNTHLCRTQITLNVDLRNYFLQQPIGNHHIVVCGKYADSIRTMMKHMGVLEIKY